MAWAQVRRAAAPACAARWAQIVVDDELGVIDRPVGTVFDTGGAGKGLCADAVAHRLGGYGRYLIDCGGDIAVGGIGAQVRPFAVDVEHPLTGSGIATSGVNVRIWRDQTGGYAHHLLDPSTGRPAWTGLVGATAFSPGGALEAETLSKMALLRGPDGARTVLAEHGGVIVHDDGEVEILGPIDCRAGASGPAAAFAA